MLLFLFVFAYVLRFVVVVLKFFFIVYKICGAQNNPKTEDLLCIISCVTK